MNLTNLNNEQLITSYLVELRQTGHILPYEDHLTVKRWVKAAGKNADNLLLILDEILPAYMDSKGGKPFRLAGVEKLVLKKIETLRSL